jgi:hypothetical protein
MTNHAPTPDLPDLGSLPEPFASSVTWRNSEGGSWQQWHDREDPMPTAWEDRPPDEVVHTYTADQMHTERQRTYSLGHAAGVAAGVPAMSEALRWLDEIERNQGGANGPTIKLRAALADRALDRMADNARELGLDYAPTPASPSRERALFDALKRISAYMPPDKLRKQAEKKYGLEPEEAIEMAYENVLQEATASIKGMRRPK